MPISELRLTVPLTLATFLSLTCTLGAVCMNNDKKTTVPSGLAWSVGKKAPVAEMLSVLSIWVGASLKDSSARIGIL